MSHLPTEMEWSSWRSSYDPSQAMSWRGSALWQFRQIEHTMGQFDAPVVVSTHRSKSIVLPVVRFGHRNGTVLVRDNFHDLNVCVRWVFPPSLPPALVFDETCFLEGIDKVAPEAAQQPWAPGRTEFTLWQPTWDHARILMRALWYARPPETAGGAA